MIRGYAAQPSPVTGGTVTLHVSTDAPRFRVELARWGTQLEHLWTSGWLPGTDAPTHLPFHDWGQPHVGLFGEQLAPWPAFSFDLDPSWRGGAYVATLVEGDETGRVLSEPPPGPDAREGKVLFVVRSTQARILYKLPLFTYSAYDMVDGREFERSTRLGHWCYYDMERHPDELPTSLDVHRPGLGTGAWPYDVGNWDPYDPTPRQTFVHWDAPFLAWLEREGYAVDVCTDLDLHREGTALLAPYRLLLSGGHDEYWSLAMRTAVERHVAGGGNAAFFGGNTVWWRVDADTPTAFRRVHPWSDPAEPHGPENTLLGVSFRNGGERDRDEHPVPVGFRVQHADHWAYAGTGLRYGDVFGAQEHLVGYECDGAEFDRADLDAGRPVVPTGRDGTPPDFTVLGVGDTRPSGWGLGNAAATMGLHSPGGTVFTGATTDWPRVLAGGRCAAVEQITRNVLDRLGQDGPPPQGV